MNPKISVIFPVSNRKEYLREAIESVLTQSFSNFELLVIEDGIQQEVEAIIGSYRDERIRTIKLPINMGISTARNAGLLTAKAPYIALMDSDDVALPDRFKKQYAWMECHPDVTVCGSNFCRLFSDGRREAACNPELDGHIKSRMLIVDSALLNPTALFRTDFVRKFDLLYDANLPRDNDHRFYVEVMRKGGTFYNIQEELLLYRRHEGNATNSSLGVDDEKTRVREVLLPLFFPELTGEEGRILLKGFCEHSTVQIADAYFCLFIMNKAMRENRSFLGEDREEIRNIVKYYGKRLAKSLDRLHTTGVPSHK